MILLDIALLHCRSAAGTDKDLSKSKRMYVYSKQGEAYCTRIHALLYSFPSWRCLFQQKCTNLFSCLS